MIITYYLPLIHSETNKHMIKTYYVAFDSF